MPTIDALAERLSQHFEPSQINLVKRAYYYAEQAHEGQYRKSGEPYVQHPLAVANLLAELGLDHETLAAAMLHDVIEDTGIPKSAIVRQFGETVAHLVDGVSKLTKVEDRTRAERQADNYFKMIRATSTDLRVIVVKLADRLHNMRTLDAMKKSKQREKAEETLQVFAPWARALGIHTIYTELEDLSFRALHPMRARYIEEAIRKRRGGETELLNDVAQRVSSALERRGIPARVQHREKHLYSIYRKMRDKQRAFNDIMDMFAFRIITDTEDNCYRALGVVHSLFRPRWERFKDYIAIPKRNGYQSLHTTTVYRRELHLEFQIRTEEMDRVANTGVAAHWMYKGGDSTLARNQLEKVEQWVKNLLEMREGTDDTVEFIDYVKQDLSQDEIFVFTPKNKVIELPAGATPIDFAYAIHTDVGNRCFAARVNNTRVPLTSELKSGSTVEIITSPSAHPHADWLNHVVTGKARTALRQYFRKQAREVGRALLDKHLKELGLSLETINEAQMQKVLQHNNLESVEQMFTDLGEGRRMPYVLASQLAADQTQAAPSETPATQDTVIRGTEGRAYRLASCCHPIPGDIIVGVDGPENQLIVHRTQCQKVRRTVGRGHFLDLYWDKQAVGEFAVAIVVRVEMQRGILADVANAVAKAEAHVETVTIKDHPGGISDITVVMRVSGRPHFARVLRRLRRLKPVISIHRQ
ncbi:MAG: bifunctional (p)ppGpp synthetase/guanosine-3',5'-bis(diphosphate) 3'-pyrophosphohydrolase [Gammaproteobacteria bacterium]|nr:MAG: bifunctional (p)ppGpp synthetase/guanosine-3',5'-bis(diphosphate) 3'-pyrophosphohydrolase [Gammaproteobacteria bacterium]